MDYFIQVVHQCGYNWEETLQALNETYQRFSTQQRRVFFVDVHPDILPVFQAELKAGLGMPVEAIAIDDIEPGMFTAQDYLLVSRYHYHGLQQKLDRHLNLIVVDVATGGESAKRIQALPEGALVVVVSRSATFLEMSEALITSLRGQSLLIRLIPESEGMEEITRAVEHADWVIFDSVVYGTLPVTVKKPHSIVHLIPSHEMQRIRQQIPLEKPLQSEPG